MLDFITYLLILLKLNVIQTLEANNTFTFILKNTKDTI